MSRAGHHKGLDRRRKLVVSLLLFLLLVLILTPPLYNRTFANPLLDQVDNAATQQIENSLTRALGAFALARATNAIISVMQETEIALSPAGIGLKLAPGQILDPLNDLVERFSWVMLIALSSLGIQRFLIELSPWLGIQLIGSLALLCWLAGLWLSPWLKFDLTTLGKRLLFLALIIRFAVPLTAALNQAVYQQFLAAEVEAASQSIKADNSKLRQLDTLPPKAGDENWWDNLKVRLQLQSGLDFEQLRTWIEQRSTRMIDNFLSLLVVFLLNSLILPLIFLWGIFRLFKALCGTALPHSATQTVSRKSAGETLCNQE